jgi:hypothetical protein
LKYSIDTSGLVRGWRYDYPPDVFPIIWDYLDDIINDGTLGACEDVLAELKTGGDELYQWVRDRRDKLIVPLSAEIQQAVSDILAVHPDWVPSDRSRNMADPFVIAVAKVHACTVVSAEAWSNSPNPERTKIPNVCDGFGIRHITFLDMMREQKWIFTRK